MLPIVTGTSQPNLYNQDNTPKTGPHPTWSRHIFLLRFLSQEILDYGKLTAKINHHLNFGCQKLKKKNALVLWEAFFAGIKRREEWKITPLQPALLSHWTMRSGFCLNVCLFLSERIKFTWVGHKWQVVWKNLYSSLFINCLCCFVTANEAFPQICFF